MPAASRLSPRARVALTIEGLNIVYPVAILRDSRNARRFVDFLAGSEARRVFLKYGFGVR